MKFKDESIESRFSDMNITAQKIASEMSDWLMTNFGKELIITATVSTRKEDAVIKRISDTHRTRRAFDVRTSNLEENEISELIEYFTLRYGKFGAVASAIPQLIVNRSHGTGPHLHVQLNRKYALKELDYGQTSGI
jgi:hypothetical protein